MGLQSATIGGGMAAARRETTLHNSDGEQSYSVPNPGVSDLDRTNDQVLDVLEGENFNNAVLVGSAAIATGAAVTTTVAAGGCAGAAAVAGAAALGTFAVVAAAGMAGGALGAAAGDALFDAFGDDLMGRFGQSKIVTEGDAPAREGDAIAHQNKNIGLLGALVGVVAAIAVGALIVATCGAGLLVLAAAAAAGGFVAGAIGTFASRAGQYGTNKGKILKGSTNVFFESKPVARTLDPILCSDHPNPPPVIAEGAKTVFVNGRNLARIGHRTTCDANINEGCSTIVTTLETSQVAEIASSVSNGLRWANIIINFLPIPRGKKRNFDASFSKTKNSLQRITKLGEPVDPTTGDFIQEWPLINLPASIPIELTITYRSTNHVSGLFGEYWMDQWSQRLTLADQSISFLNQEGVDIEYYTPNNAVNSRHTRHPKYQLFGERDGLLRIVDQQQRLVYTFGEIYNKNTRLLSRIEDFNQNSIQFNYDEHSRLYEIAHSDGFCLQIRLERGLIVSVKGEEQYSLLDCHYRQGYLSARKSLQHGSMHYQYNQQGHMTRWYDNHQTDAYISYDNQGRVIATQTQSGHYNDRFEYDDEQQLTRYYDAEGGITQVYYDKYQQVTCLIDPANNPQHFQYDIQGNHTAVCYANGQIEHYQYNDAGLLLKHTTRDGLSTQYAYNDQGQLCQVDTPRGQSWQYIYTDKGNLSAEIHPNGERSTYRYGEKGELYRAYLADGREQIYAYDERRRLCRVTEGDTVTELKYDLLGRLQHVEDSERGHTYYHYSANHPGPQRIDYPDGTAESFGYDNENLLNSITDGKGKTTRYHYGAFDLLESITHPDKSTLHFHYDKLTRLTKVTNASGDSYHYQYDKAGRLIKEIDFRQISTGYGYDEMNQCIAKRTADNVLHRYYYDEQGNINTVQQIQADNKGQLTSDVLAQTDFEYDTLGQLTKATNTDACVELEYNQSGQLICERINGREVQYQYHGKTHQRQQLRWGEQQVDYQHSNDGHLTQLQIAGHQPLHFNYDSLGRETLRQQAGFALINQYSATGLLTAQAAGVWDKGMQEQYQRHQQWARSTWSPETLHGSQLTRRYRYDNAMNLLSISDSQGKSQYQYNSNDQIIQATHSGNPQPFVRNQLNGQSQQTSSDTATESFSYDANRQLTQSQHMDSPRVQHKQRAGCVVSVGNSSYQYDALGRLVQKTEIRDGFRPQTSYYRWNHDNQLVELRTANGDHWRYGYDAFGRRVRKLKVIDGAKAANTAKKSVFEASPFSKVTPLYPETPPAESNISSTQTQLQPQKVIGTEFLWSGSQLIEEAPIYADGSIGYQQATHWYYKDSEFTPSVQVSHNNGTRRLHHVISDHLGTPREMMDEQGDIVWRRKHSTWGSTKLWPMAQTAAANDALHCPFVFPGQYEDQESGLHYNRYRYYNPQTAQYLTPDPLGLEGGFTPQSYVYNPNGWIDPLGLAGCNNSKNVKEFDVVPYRPTNSPLVNHHGVNDVWAKNNVPGYISRKADNPTIALSVPAHKAAHKAGNDYLRETVGSVRGQAKNLNARQMQQMAERQFDAAKVPQAARQNYYNEFNRYIYGK